MVILKEKKVITEITIDPKIEKDVGYLLDTAKIITKRKYPYNSEDEIVLVAVQDICLAMSLNLERALKQGNLSRQEVVALQKASKLIKDAGFNVSNLIKD